jgi:molybdate transport system regulatory protein
MASQRKRASWEVKPRLRICRSENVALGPGKVELLSFVGETGSIGEAAKRMDMSYMRAWTLIQTMNECFKEPVILTVRGGKSGGGAELTDTGRRALEIYRRMEAASRQAAGASWDEFRELLRG